jgi:dolichyl-phosphate-mannose-protein mannosyltransferase
MKPVKKKRYSFQKTSTEGKPTRFDWIAIAIIMVVYSCIALFHLGGFEAPQSAYTTTNSPTNMVFDLGSETSISKIKFYLGTPELNESRSLSFDFSDQADSGFTNLQSVNRGNVFAWNDVPVEVTARYVRVKTNGNQIMLNEISIINAEGNVVTPQNASEFAALFDEQAMTPDRISLENSTYFDEIYHARTGYELLHGLPVYEWTHPPLGKIFISLGIAIFGMVPFGWRIVGTIFGILMIPAIYLFAKRLFKHSWLAVVTCLLFTFDFMHFVQTRIATIDVYVTFFIILMYYFMYKYYTMSFYDTPLRKTLVPLALSGLCMGLGIASKWTGVYAGCGLAVLFFLTLFRRFREYSYAKTKPRGQTDGIQHEAVIQSFQSNTIKTLLWCCLFFIVVPIIIYLLAYIPYVRCTGGGFASILKNQADMLTYHSKTVLTSTHPFSSHWYEWPIMRRPIWYYSSAVSNTVKEGISAFGNPLVWWLGIAAFVYMIYLAIAKKDKTALFLIIAYLAQLVSWIPVTRITFIYHYFPCVPFIVLMLGHSIYRLYQANHNYKYAAFVYAGLVVVLFAFFYPVLSGLPMNVEFVKTWMEWFPTWILI